MLQHSAKMQSTSRLHSTVMHSLRPALLLIWKLLGHMRAPRAHVCVPWKQWLCTSAAAKIGSPPCPKPGCAGGGGAADGIILIEMQEDSQGFRALGLYHAPAHPRDLDRVLAPLLASSEAECTNRSLWASHADGRCQSRNLYRFCHFAPNPPWPPVLSAFREPSRLPGRRPQAFCEHPPSHATRPADRVAFAGRPQTGMSGRSGCWLLILRNCMLHVTSVT